MGKLTIDQLKNYLSTGLEIKFETTKEVKTHVLDLHNIYDALRYTKNYRILCYRLSDIDKHIPELGFVPLHKLLEEYCFDLSKMDNKEILSYKYSMVEVDISFQVASMLFSWHFWPFEQEYFDQGLVLNKMTYGKEASNE